MSIINRNRQIIFFKERDRKKEKWKNRKRMNEKVKRQNLLYNDVVFLQCADAYGQPAYTGP